MLVTFEGISSPVLLDGCEELLDPLPSLVNGWRFFEANDAAAAPIITVTRHTDGYRIEAPALYRDPRNYRVGEFTHRCQILGALFSELSVAFAMEISSLACLHCAGSKIGDKLIAFLGAGRAGKSTLSIWLTAAGARFFSDDILPLSAEDDTVASVGFAPRLRLPPAEIPGKRFQDFIRSRIALSGGGYQYVLPDPEYWAKRGETAPIAAFVILERGQEIEKAELIPARKSELLRMLLVQNFEASTNVSGLFTRLHDMAGRIRGYRLRYAESEQAAPLLLDSFAG